MSNIVLPDDTTLQNCIKLSLKLNKPIDTYFYRDSLTNNVKFLTSGGESYIYKNEDEHTTSISNTYSSGNCYIVVTDNTIHLVSNQIQVENHDE
jgi:hypothetical protein